VTAATGIRRELDDTSADLPLVVSEIFGPTVQGEGPSAGRRCAFLRLGGCNLSCRWCDTPYTWDWTGTADGGIAYDPKTELRTLSRAHVLERLRAYEVDLVVISGGEPMNQQDRLPALLRELSGSGRQVEIETNGTRVPSDALVASGARFNVSPKLAHSGDTARQRIVPEALRALAALPDTAFKFVCRDTCDLDEVAELVERYGFRSVWVMPEGRNPTDMGRHLASLGDEVVARGWNLTTRLHVAVWGDKRGV
jgi:7-carboxy-7-deazaguanine synthase